MFISSDSILFNILFRESLLVSKIVVSGVFVVRNLVPNAFLKIVTCNEHACILMFVVLVSRMCGRFKRGKGFSRMFVDCDVTPSRPELRANFFRCLLLQLVCKLL